MSAEYRIEYTIQRAASEDDEFEEIGYGSSGAWSDIDGAGYALTSYLSSWQWETEGDMPDPAVIRAEIEEAQS